MTEAKGKLSDYYPDEPDKPILDALHFIHSSQGATFEEWKQVMDRVTLGAMNEQAFLQVALYHFRVDYAREVDEKIRYLLERGVNVHGFMESDGLPPLHEATLRHFTYLVELLLFFGANPNRLVSSKPHLHHLCEIPTYPLDLAAYSVAQKLVAGGAYLCYSKTEKNLKRWGLMDQVKALRGKSSSKIYN